MQALDKLSMSFQLCSQIRLSNDPLNPVQISPRFNKNTRYQANVPSAPGTGYAPGNTLTSTNTPTDFVSRVEDAGKIETDWWIVTDYSGETETLLIIFPFTAYFKWMYFLKS